MKLARRFALLSIAALLAAGASAQEIPLQKNNSPTPQIDLRVFVDISVEFWIQGARVRYDSGGTRAPRNAGSAYSAPLPRYTPPNLRVDKEDGRGDIVVLEQPSANNAWTLKIRISDPKGGEDRYHVRVSWGGESAAPTAPTAPTSRYVEISEMSVTASGAGQIRMGAQRFDLNETSVSLTPSGRAILSFQGASQPRFRGTWRQDGSRIVLNLDDVLGSGQGSATGQIRLSGDRLRSIDIEGADPTQSGFDLSFDQRGDYKDFTQPAQAATVPAPSPNRRGDRPVSGVKTTADIVSPDPPGTRSGARAPISVRGAAGAGIDQVSERLRGDGYLESTGRGEQDDALEEVLVRLDAGGRARFELDGGQYWSILGTWRQLSNDRVEVQLEQLNSAPATGRGTVLFRTDRRGKVTSVRQVEMTITASRVGALDVRFRPGE